MRPCLPPQPHQRRNAASLAPAHSAGTSSSSGRNRTLRPLISRRKEGHPGDSKGDHFRHGHAAMIALGLECNVAGAVTFG